VTKICDSSRVVLDNEKLVLSHYEAKMDDPGSIGRQWLTHMLSNGKFESVDRLVVGKGMKVKLKEANFPPHHEDFTKYCRTAAASSSKRLVTYDSDYTAKKKKLLKKLLGLAVQTAEGALLVVHGSCGDAKCMAPHAT
jgi:hypothetical protein